MKAYSVDLRQKIIDAHNLQEGSQRQLAKRFRVSLSFIENLLKRYRLDGTVEARAHGGGRAAKLDAEQETVLIKLVEEDNDAILVELCARLEQRVGVRVSRATMGRIVQKLKLTRKKNSPRNGARNGESTAVASPILASHVLGESILSQKLAHEIGAVKLEDLVFVDETGSNLAMTRRYARSLKGSRAYNNAPYSAGTEFNIDWCNGATGTHW